jgi:hypothetical protein
MEAEWGGGARGDIPLVKIFFEILSVFGFILGM